MTYKTLLLSILLLLCWVWGLAGVVVVVFDYVYDLFCGVFQIMFGDGFVYAFC